MSTRRKNQPYLELGETLIAWRSAKYRSALAFYNSTKFSFSYSAYADFERGVTLPTIETLLEIAEFHGVNKQDAALHWAQSQMPSQDLKSIFQARAKRRTINITTPEDTRQANATPPSMENTWIFSLKDQEDFKKNPWLSDVLMKLISVYPFETHFSALGLENIKAFKKFKEIYLKDWINQGHILETKEALKLARPHYYFPKTKDWQALRKKLFLRAVERLSEFMSAEEIELTQSLRVLESRTFTGEQRERWTKKLQAVVHEFLSDPYERSNKQHKVFGLALAFGERPLEIPDEILKKIKK